MDLLATFSRDTSTCMSVSSSVPDLHVEPSSTQPARIFASAPSAFGDACLVIGVSYEAPSWLGVVAKVAHAGVLVCAAAMRLRIE